MWEKGRPASERCVVCQYMVSTYIYIYTEFFLQLFGSIVPDTRAREVDCGRRPEKKKKKKSLGKGAGGRRISVASTANPENP